MAADQPQCAVCGACLAPCGVGRPPTYCGTGCRRRRERELARQRRPERLRAAEIAEMEAVLAGDPPWWWCGSEQGARARLAELLTVSN